MIKGIVSFHPKNNQLNTRRDGDKMTPSAIFAIESVDKVGKDICSSIL